MKKGISGIFPIVVSIVVHACLLVFISVYISKTMSGHEYLTVSFMTEKQIQSEAPPEPNNKIKRTEEIKGKEETKKTEEIPPSPQKVAKKSMPPPKPNERAAGRKPEQSPRRESEELVPPPTPAKAALPTSPPPAPAREIQPPPPVSTVQVASWNSSDGKSDIPSGDGKRTVRRSHRGVPVAGPDSGEARDGGFGRRDSFGSGSGTNHPGSVNGDAGKGGSAKKETGSDATGRTNNNAPAASPKDKNKIIQEYKQLIISIIEMKKIYPPQARRKGIEGSSEVSFTLTQNGDISDISISKSSGYNFFDAESMNIFKRIGKFPPPPAEIVTGSRKMNLAVFFRLE